MFARALAFAALAGWGAAPAWAYPTYHRLGYLSCVACHHLSTGGGVLTPYGKSVGDTLSALAPKEARDYQPSWFEGMVQSRTMLQTMQSGVSAPRAQLFAMQLDALASVTPPGGVLQEKLRGDFALGLGLRRSPTGGFVDVQPGWGAVVLRRALLTASLTDELQLSGGRDFLPDGLAIEDHTSYLRARGRRGVYDYPTQLRLTWLKEAWVIQPYAFGPTFEETPDNREWGGGSRVEWSFAQNQSVGLSATFGQSAAIRRWVGAAFTRLSLQDWNGLIAEYSFTLRQAMDGSYSPFGQHLVYAKPYIVLPGWLETGWVVEGLLVGFPFEEQGLRTGPSVNLRLLRGINFLLDLRYTASLGSGPAANWLTGWVGTFQAFLWI